MRPSCSFCGKPCFASLPKGTPVRIMEAYQPITLAATCMEGRAFEKSRIGFSYDDVRIAMNRASKKPTKMELYRVGREVEAWLNNPS